MFLVSKLQIVLLLYCALVIKGSAQSGSFCINTTLQSEFPQCSNETGFCQDMAFLNLNGKIIRHFNYKMIQTGEVVSTCPFGCEKCLSHPQFNCRGTIGYNSSKDTHKHFEHCICSLGNYTQTFQCLYNGKYFQNCSLIYTIACLMMWPYNPPKSNDCPFGWCGLNSKKRGIEQTPVSSVSFNIPQLIVQTPPTTNNSIFVSWQYLSASNWIQCKPGICDINIPYTTFESSGNLVVKVFINDALDNSLNFFIAPKDSCSSVNIGSIDFFTKYQCHMGWFLVVMTAMVVLFIVVLIIIYKLICWCINKPAGVNVTNNYNDMPANDGKWFQMQPFKMPTGQMNTVTLIVVIGLLLSVVGGQVCTQGVVVTSSGGSCLVNGQTETCSFSSTTLLSLPYIGGTACMHLESLETGQTLGTIYVTYRQMIKTVSLVHNYYTSSWIGLQSSSRSCPCTNECGACDSTTPYDMGIWGSPSTFYPGVSICTSQCGCAGCGCFCCSSSCVFSRYAFQPTGGIANVLSPLDTSLNPSINFAWNFGGVTGSQNFDITAGYVDLGNNLSAAIVGSLSSSSTDFGTLKLVSYNGVAYLGATSPSNGPTNGLPGDIQSPTTSGLTSPNINSFIFSRSIATPQYSTGQTTYSFASPGLDLLTTGQYTRLPAVLGSTLYTYSNGLLVGTDSQPGALLVTFTMNTPLVISSVVNVVCPNLVSVAVAGCYLCPTGAQFIIQAASLCSPGFVNVAIQTQQNITLANYAIRINQTISTYYIGYNTPNKFIVGKLCLKAGSKTSCLDFQGTLDNPTGIVVTNETYPPGWVRSTGEQFFDWWNGLASPLDIVKWVIVAIICIAIAAFIGGLIYLGVVYGIPWWKARQGVSYEKVPESDTVDELVPVNPSKGKFNMLEMFGKK